MFIKFKDYIRKIKNGVSDDLEDLKLTLKIIEGSPFEYSSLAKMVKETNFPLISNVFNDVFGEDFTKYNKERAIAKINERIGILEKYLKNYMTKGIFIKVLMKVYIVFPVNPFGLKLNL